MSRFKPGMVAWIKVRVKGPVNVLGSDLTECEVLKLDGSIAEPGFLYVVDQALIVDSVARTARENASRPQPKQEPRQHEYRDEW